MIKVSKLHYEIRRQLSRVHGDYKSHIDVVEIDGYINQAKEVLLENYNAIVEKNKTISNRLKSLEIKGKKLDYLEKTPRSFIFKLPQDHYSTLNRYGKIDACGTIVEIFIHDTQTHKIEESLRNPNTSPNVNWRETFSNEDSKGIHLYHGNILDIKEAYIDYIRWIPDVAYVSGASGVYINADGETPTQDKHLLIEDSLLWRKFTDVAVYLIKRDFDENYQVNLETILFNEKSQLS